LWKKINTGEVWQCCTVLHPFRIRLCDTFGLEKVERSWGLLETDSWKYDHIGTVTKCHADPDNDSADDESENIYEPVAENKKALWVVTDCCTRQPFWGKKKKNTQAPAECSVPLEESTEWDQQIWNWSISWLCITWWIRTSSVVGWACTSFSAIVWCSKASSDDSSIISRLWKTFHRIQCSQHHYSTAEQHVSLNRTSPINCTWGLQKQTAEINCTCANMHGFEFDLSDCMQSNCYGHRKCNTVDYIYCFWRFNNLKQVKFYIYLGIRQHIRTLRTVEI